MSEDRPAQPNKAAEPEVNALFRQLWDAIQNDDAERVRTLLDRHSVLKEKINEPLGPFDAPAITAARSREMIDALLAAGADLNARSQWWAGGFGLLDWVPPEAAAHAIARGAIVDVHSAARLGLFDRLRTLIESDPELVHARGGDGQTPLHFASSVETAAYLLDHGADINARDVDHESTPAQYMLDHRPDVARYLVERGCRTDLLLTAAVGDLERVRAHLDADPACLRIRANAEWFPMANPRAGGIIYEWTIGNKASAYQAAAKFGHNDILKVLMDRSPPDAKLIASCWLGDEAMVRDLLAQHPGLAGTLPELERNEVARAARNNHANVVKLMVEAGLPVTARGQHRATPLHWGAWHGNIAMVRAILSFAPPLEDDLNDFHATPLGWAMHGSENGWYRSTGDYPAVVEALLAAGAKPLDSHAGTEAEKSDSTSP